MSRSSDRPPLTRAVALRGLLLLLAAAVAVLATWLVVTGNTPRRVQLGVIAGLWSALLAAFAVLGARRPAPVAKPAGPSPAEQVSRHLEQTAHDLERAQAGAMVQLREAMELERAYEVSARQERDAFLLDALRHEVEQAMSAELGQLRAQVAALRSEVIDNVGGQIRLERIETTRLIGSDLQALHQEVRQLKSARDVSPRDITPRDITLGADPAELVAAPEVVTAPTARAVEDSVDLFASLPRLAPWADPDPDPAEADASSYRGRRRRAEEPGGARHAAAFPDSPGGRRHRGSTSAAEPDVLARLLEREGAV